MRERFVLALALANAALYCCALPLWEGFDEPFHYAYLESLETRTVPVMNRAQLSDEIHKSFSAVPVSRLLSQAMPSSLSFEEWSQLSQSEREVRRARLHSLSPEMRTRSSGILNYEAQQAPLAYFLYAPFDLLFSSLELSARILLLRLLSAFVATLATFAALIHLARLLEIRGAFRTAAILVVLNGQMFWASVAHVGNDFAAVPLTTWFLVLLMQSAASPRQRNLLILAAVLAGGLLTKAYFLAFAPVFFALLTRLLINGKTSIKAATASAALVVLVAGPWYWRNHLLYGSFSGTQQSLAGIGFSQALAALPHINWLSSAGQFAMWSLWTGNWSFLSFSQLTLKCELLLFLVSSLMYLWFSRRSDREEEIWALIACGAFGLSLVYQTCVTWVHTHGASTFPEPWYAQGAIALCVVLCFRGLAKGSAIGKSLAVALVILTSWIALLTYVAKLLPYYGAAINRSNFRTLWTWWNTHPSADLRSLIMIPVPLLYVLLVVYVGLLLLAAMKTTQALIAKATSV